MNGEFKEHINEIIADHESGSTEILGKTIDTCKNYLQRSTSEKMLLVDSLNELFRHHSSMVILFSFINSLFQSIENTDNWQQAGLDFIKRFLEKRKTYSLHMAENLIKQTDLSRKSILLHSNSFTVTEVFRHLADMNIYPRIFQTQSGPVNEGWVQAEKMAETGFKVVFISDTAVWKFLDEVDMAVFGADAVYEDYFVNKSGTALYSMALRQHNKSVYVLAESGKFLNSQNLPPQLYKRMSQEAAKSADELWKNPPAGAEVRNYYFEGIPNSMVNAFVTEAAMLKTDELKEHTVGQQLSNLFNFEEHPGF